LAIGLKGYKFGEWMKANKSNLRLILAGIIGLITTALNGMTSPTAIALGGIVTAASKFILDGIDFYFSD